MKYLLLSLLCLSGCLDLKNDETEKINQLLSNLRYEDCVRVKSGFYKGFDGQVIDIVGWCVAINLRHYPKELNRKFFLLDVNARYLEKIECK